MPIITVEGPRVEIEAKRKLVREMTETASEVFGFSKEEIIVLLKENTPENVGVAGELIIDRMGRERGG